VEGPFTRIDTFALAMGSLVAALIICPEMSREFISSCLSQALKIQIKPIKKMLHTLLEFFMLWWCFSTVSFLLLYTAGASF
jgi:uncharacterized protein YybS (DUF2232 family)